MKVFMAYFSPDIRLEGLSKAMDTSVRIIGALAKIRTEQLINISLTRFSFNTLVRLFPQC
jgi:hypothetical protein